MNLYKKLTAKPAFLVTDATLASDNPLHFTKNFYNSILTDEQQKYQHYHLEKLMKSISYS